MATERRRVRRLRLAAIFVTLGLVTEIISLQWAHPTAFLVFALGAGLSIGAGALLFLMTLFGTGPERS